MFENLATDIIQVWDGCISRNKNSKHNDHLAVFGTIHKKVNSAIINDWYTKAC